MSAWRAALLVAVMVPLAGCPDDKPPPRHFTVDQPARVDDPPPAVKDPPRHHPSHEHPHGPHPHPASDHHHHPHPHPHLAGANGHHHPY